MIMNEPSAPVVAGMKLRPETDMGLTGVRRLFDDLNRQDVRYCHWKSNVRLGMAVCGKTDLDLLVDPQHSQRFHQIISKHGLKTLRAAPGKRYPGVENYLGFDPETGELFHLHVHYQLILGEQHIKNYVLPLTDRFLSAVQLRSGVKVPRPELELIVFCARALLKYRDRDAIKDFLSIRSPGLSPVVLQEIEWLLEQTWPEVLEQTSQDLDGVIPAKIVHSLLSCIDHSPRDGARLFQLRQQLRKALRPYRRQNQLRASLTYFRELWFRRQTRMRLQDGGCLLVLIGTDGAGKSTMCRLLQKWLSWKLDARLFYLGSKQPSQRSKLLYLLFRASRRSQRAVAGRRGHENWLARKLASLRQALRYSHMVSLAQDRLRRYEAAQRLAAAGAVVIFDRFPLTTDLDGAKIERLAQENGSSLAHSFSRIEKDIYDRFQIPEHLFLLDVTPDVSLSRKPDHHREAIEAKYQSLQALANNDALPIRRIDASQPLEDVSLRLKQSIWQIL